jgi:hypothetical protein
MRAAVSGQTVRGAAQLVREGAGTDRRLGLTEVIAELKGKSK